MSMTNQTPVMPSSSSAAPTDIRRIDPRIWQACAGSTFRMPTVNSRVYYFPQGHLEQSASASAPILSRLVLSKPCIGCVIASTSFHADVATDEVFTRVKLHPVEAVDSFSVADGRFDGGVLEEEKIKSYAKILTASDANNGGGFSVPRSCAEMIFPPLNFKDDPPVQTLVVSDLHGVSWSFRHIFRGTPRRHLLTTGWSKFVNSKKLVAGDSVLFMKNSHGNIFVGFRRVTRTYGAADFSNWEMQTDATNVKVDDEITGKAGFSRNGRGRVPLDSIVNSMEMAARGFPFEVIYYPRVGWSDFVVKADLVEAAMRIYWTPGLRVKMAAETDDSSRMTWFQGTVSSTSAPENEPWQGSPWRTIQITWDEPEVMLNARCVNPWQVEVAMTNSPSSDFMFLPTRRPRSACTRTDPPRFINVSEPPIPHFSVSGYNSTSASIQGARQDAYVASNYSHYFDIYNPHSVLKTQSTEFNNGSSSENILSPDSISSGLSFAMEVVPRQEPATPKDAPDSIKLFGKTIYVDRRIDSPSDETNCAEDDGGSRDMDVPLSESCGNLRVEA